MSRVLVTGPTVEPVTLEEIKAFLKISGPRRPASMDEPRDDGGEGFQEPAPVAPDVDMISPAAPGNVTNGIHRWLQTFVTADGETNAGQVSEALEVVDKAVNGKVTVALSIGGAAVTARKVYRTVAGGSTYMLVGTIANNADTSYTDNVADGSLGVGAPALNTTGHATLISLRSSARQWLERLWNRALLTQTWDLFLPHFPREPIALPWAPLASVSSVNYTPEDGAELTVDSDDYVVDVSSAPGMIHLKASASWPDDTLDPGNAVRIRYVAGFTSVSDGRLVPLALAIKQLVNHWYNSGSPVITGTIAADLPLHIRELVHAYRIPMPDGCDW